MGVSERVLVDTGPIVAILISDDPHHAACTEELRKHKQPWITCWPVLTEAAWLVRKEPGGVERLFELVLNSVIEIVELDAKAPAWVAGFLQRYASIKAQVADAALMYLAEQRDLKRILTLDRRDFSVYRTAAGKGLELLPTA